ncbi:MAG: hypothetical protein AAFV29_11470, partial [Myxococcota bacterium]
IATVAYLAAFALFFPQPWWRISASDRLRRLLTLAPYAVAVVGWKWAHSAGGYGAANSGLYIDPIREPGLFWEAVVVRVPVLLSAQWTPVPSDLVMVMGEGGRVEWAVVAALLVATLSTWIWRRSQRHQAVGMWLTGATLAALPIAAAFPSNRLLMFVGLGVFGALGDLIESWMLPTASHRLGSGLKLVAGASVASHLVVAPVASMMAAPAVHLLGETLPSRCADAVEPDAPLDDVTLVFINAHALCAAYVGPSRALDGATMPVHVRVLASIFSDIEIKRVDAKTLLIDVAAGYHQHPMDRLMRRGDRPLPVGSTVELTGFTAVIEAHNAGGRVRRVRFIFAEPLDSPRLRFFELVGGGTRPFAVPTVGASVRIAAQLPLI